ncbi:MAG: S26 family signal peptidase [Candidatus Scalindua sp.]|nr:S26 family signal peptidase [Candidatus Scalindua sp.]
MGVNNEKKKEKKSKGFVRENFESILIAIFLAFILRIFIVEAFKIPTGSMAPTLLGLHKVVKCPNCSWKFDCDHNSSYVKCSNCFYSIRLSDYRKSGGNRILVNKFIYDFGKPDRWDVTVFIYPYIDVACRSCGFFSQQSMICGKCSNASLKKENFIDAKFNTFKGYLGLEQFHRVTCKSCDVEEKVVCEQCNSTNTQVVRKNYIKRMIGLPGEKLQIVNGDIYINGKIQRKPEKVQEKLWVPVFDSNYQAKQEISTAWNMEESFWNQNNGELHLTVHRDENKSSFATFSRKITDSNVYNGRTSNAIVGDILVKFDCVAMRDTGGISIKLESGDNLYETFIRSKNEKRKSYLKGSDMNLIENADIFLEQDRKYRIEFSNVDKSLTLKLDGTVVFSHNFDVDLSSVDRHTFSSRLMIGGIDTESVFRNISVFRDIFYADSGQWGTEKPVILGEKEYFVLGDNSRNSNDSRFWKLVPEDSLVGKAFIVFWPLRTINFVK